MLFSNTFLLFFLGIEPGWLHLLDSHAARCGPVTAFWPMDPKTAHVVLMLCSFQKHSIVTSEGTMTQVRWPHRKPQRTAEL